MAVIHYMEGPSPVRVLVAVIFVGGLRAALGFGALAKGSQRINLLLPAIRPVGVVCASPSRSVTNSR